MHKGTIAVAATLAALGMIFSTFHIHVSKASPWVWVEDGDAMAGEIADLKAGQMQLLKDNNFLLKRATREDRRRACGDAGDAMIRLGVNPNDAAARQSLEIARDGVAEANKELNYLPPPSTGNPC